MRIVAILRRFSKRKSIFYDTVKKIRYKNKMNLSTENNQI